MNDFKLRDEPIMLLQDEEIVPVKEQEPKLYDPNDSIGAVKDWHKSRLERVKMQINEHKAHIKELHEVIDSKQEEVDMLEQTLYHLEK